MALEHYSPSSKTVNAGAYFSKPGPRTITGLEVLAKIIDPLLWEYLHGNHIQSTTLTV